MANSKQAEKRNRQNQTRRIRNRLTMGAMRTAVKAARSAVDSGAPEAAALVKSAISRIDSAVTKGALKKQTASRYISRLAKRKA
jgi:small subunit ribosomal protein S20